jgi:6-phosphogluconolactonase (cycloisomerase 2 family)
MRVSARLARALALAAVGLAAAGSASARAASVYVTAGASSPGQVYVVPVDPNGAIPTSTPSSSSTTTSFAGGVGPAPGGHQLYVSASSGAGVIDQFAVGAGGSLQPLTPAGVTTGASPAVVVVSPNGKSVYTATTSPCCSVDQFMVQANGTLKAKSPASVPSDGQFDVVMTPDGRHLYVSNFGAPGLIDQYNVAADGTLSAMNPASVSTGEFPLAMAVAPNGHSLYAGIDPGVVAQFTITASGALTAKTPATVAMANNMAYPQSMAVSPNGRNLYVADGFAGTGVEQFTIGSGGAATAMNPGYVGTNDVSHVIVSPDGKSLYAASATGTTRYSVGAGGGLTLTTDTADTGDAPAGIAISPDQGPVAEFVASPEPPGRATVFFGAASHDPDGKVVRYSWTFGDGKSATTSTSTVRHAYARPGHYVATLTVTDNDGASTQQVFTGHQVLLNGGPAARTTRTVTVVAPPKLTGLRIDPGDFKVGSAGHGGATVSYRVAGAGQVALTVQRIEVGRREGKRCVAGRRTGAKCSIYVALPGAEPVSGKRGQDHFHFSGRWGGKALPAGRYRLRLLPFAGMITGPASTATFTIVG